MDFGYYDGSMASSLVANVLSGGGVLIMRKGMHVWELVGGGYKICVPSLFHLVVNLKLL